MSLEQPAAIRFRQVSKFYGEIQGVSRVDLSIGAGITSLVGPNGAGKSTLLNLIAGLLRPSVGTLEVLGETPGASVGLYHRLGFCTQYDGFPESLTGYAFVFHFLRMHGFSLVEAEARAKRAIARVGMDEAASRKVDAYSKGMRQRIKIAQAISHEPQVLLLDEPLNGLDPVARAEIIALMRAWRDEGRTVVISSHILHEVDVVSDQIILMHGGYVVAEGDIPTVRREIRAQPLQLEIRCPKPGRLASRLFELDEVVEIKLRPDRSGLLVRTVDAERFYAVFNRLAAEDQTDIRGIAPADEDVQAAYDYLIGAQGEGA